MKLPQTFRDEFKKPLGHLIPNSDVTKKRILQETSLGGMIITVGDATTQRLLDYEIIPDIQIVDGLEKRSKRAPPSSPLIKTSLSCSNPAGEISEQSLRTIQEAFKSPKPVRILIEGEEDLLVLPVCLESSTNSVILYGQPNEGLVVVRVTDTIKNKVKSLLDLME